MKEDWSIRSSSELLVEEIDEFLSCYCFSTGITHILNAFPAEILKFLFSGDKSTSEINEHLAFCLAEEPGERAVEISHLLRELRDLQLIYVCRV